jgi:pimeloyl-ACP methyl ester carboxylesterase
MHPLEREHLGAVARDEVALIEPVLARAGSPLSLVGHSYGAERFIDYWMGIGSWKATPENRKPPIAASVANIRRWAHALFTEPTPLAAFRSLDVPVFYMVGKRSTASARGVARLLTKALPRVEVLEFHELGHMGPITHPDPVNEAIARFLERA